MKKKLMQMTAILSAALMLTGCVRVQSNNNPQPSKPGSSQTQNTLYTPSEGTVSLTAGKQGGMVVSAVPTDEQIDHLSVAGTNLMAEVTSHSSDDENILLSPVSIWMAIGMTENGASGFRTGV